MLVLVWCGFGRLASGSAFADVLPSKIQDRIQQGDPTAASGQLSSALRTFPREPGLHNLLGGVEARQANFSAAESSFRKAVQLLPQFTSAWAEAQQVRFEQIKQNRSENEQLPWRSIEVRPY